MVDIAIYGAGGFGKEVLTLLKELNREEARYRFIGFFDDAMPTKEFSFPYLGNWEVINRWPTPLQLVVAMGWSHVRQEAQSRVDNPLIQFPTLVSPSAYVGDRDRITMGKGTLILSGARLTTDIELGDFVVINLNATVGHDVRMGSFTSLMPSVNISGAVTLGSAVFIGSGATVLQQLTVGDGATIGAGSVVVRPVPVRAVVAGVPAKKIESR